jgi:hypothetical protein
MAKKAPKKPKQSRIIEEPTEEERMRAQVFSGVGSGVELNEILKKTLGIPRCFVTDNNGSA